MNTYNTSNKFHTIKIFKNGRNVFYFFSWEGYGFRVNEIGGYSKDTQWVSLYNKKFNTREADIIASKCEDRIIFFEKQWIALINNSKQINPKFHELDNIHGLGPKIRNKILEERAQKFFTNFSDLTSRVGVSVLKILKRYEQLKIKNNMSKAPKGYWYRVWPIYMQTRANEEK